VSVIKKVLNFHSTMAQSKFPDPKGRDGDIGMRERTKAGLKKSKGKTLNPIIPYLSFRVCDGEM
jgi:hypothetical protein